MEYLSGQVVDAEPARISVWLLKKGSFPCFLFLRFQEPTSAPGARMRSIKSHYIFLCPFGRRQGSGLAADVEETFVSELWARGVLLCGC